MSARLKIRAGLLLDCVSNCTYLGFQAPATPKQNKIAVVKTNQTKASENFLLTVVADTGNAMTWETETGGF